MIDTGKPKHITINIDFFTNDISSSHFSFATYWLNDGKIALLITNPINETGIKNIIILKFKAEITPEIPEA